MDACNPTKISKCRQCQECGKLMKRRGKVCRKCKLAKAEANREAKERRRQELLARKCKVCDQAMNSLDPRKVVCSRECRDEGRRQRRVVVSCCVCKNEVLRYPAQANARTRFCCSLKCQRHLALTVNRGRPPKSPSKIKLPVIWFCGCGHANAGKHCQNSGCELRLVRKAIQKVKTKRKFYEEAGGWDHAIRFRLATSKKRIQVRRSNIATGFDASNARKQMMLRRKYYTRCTFEKKIANKLSNLRKRRRARDGEMHSNSGGGEAKVDRSAIQMQFDWMAA